MQIKELSQEENGQRRVAMVLDTGEEFLSSIEQLATRDKIIGASFSAIGAFQEATLGYFDWETKRYKDISIDQQVEVVSLSGNIARKSDGGTKVHAHGVVGLPTGQARAGHILKAIVRPTLEVIIVEVPSHLTRHFDENVGLALIDLNAQS